MDILAPVNRADEVEQLIRSGAAEIYCSVLSPQWRERYSNVGSISREEFTLSSLRSYEELEQVTSIAHDNGARVSVAFNQDFYSSKQLPLVLKEVDQAVGAGIDNLIIADVALMATLRDREVECDVHASSIAAVFNARAARFLQRLGVSRLILPHHLTLNEVRTLAERVPDIPLEAFVLNARCPNVEGFCGYLHGLLEIAYPRRAGALFSVLGSRWGAARSTIVGALLRLPRWSQRLGPLAHHASLYLCPNAAAVRVSCLEGDHALAPAIEERFGMDWCPNVGGIGCGVCALGMLRDAGVSVVKVQGRNYPTAKKLADVRFLRSALDALENLKGGDTFHERCRALYSDSYDRPCSLAECYWPEEVR